MSRNRWPGPPSDDDERRRDEIVAVLAQVRGRLSPEQRRILRLRWGRRLSHAQIAAALGRDEQTVARHMRHILAQIRTAFPRVLGGLVGLGLGLAAVPGAARGQQDPTWVGPPPHFVAAGAPPGTVLDVSRMGVLRHRLSVHLTAVPLPVAVAAIRDQAHLNLVYDQQLLPAERIVSLQAEQLTVASAFAEVLLDTEIDVVLTRSGQLALVRCPHGVGAGTGTAAPGAIAGRVVDRATGAPVAGATVLVAGTPLSAVTNAAGQYQLAGVAAGLQRLTARYIGYQPASDTVQVGAGAAAGAAVRNFVLAPSAQQLDQLVVTGTLLPTEVKTLPTPITIITAEEIQRQHVVRLDQLFRGQVPQAFAWDYTTFDYFSTINVRGASSLDNKPVKVLLDGIELAAPEFIATIDPNSIERIELSRGPQASTMYGSGAAGGVLQVFMKKGKFGLARPEGELTASVGLVENRVHHARALRAEEALTLQGGGQQTRYHVAGYYRHDGEWAPSYRNTNWSVTAGAENVAGPLTARFSARYARKTFDRVWYTMLRDSGYTFFSQPPYEVFDNRSQTYGVSFTYTPQPWWQHELVLGYDQLHFELFQTRPRFTTPADSLLHLTAVHPSKASLFYSTTVQLRPAGGLGVKLTAGVNHSVFHLSRTITANATRIANDLDGTTLVTRYTVRNSGLLAQAQVEVAAALFLTAGVRAEWNPNFGTRFGAAISPRVGVAYVRPVGPAVLKLRWAYGESIRPPEPYQSTGIPATPSNPAEQVANPRLGPERQRGWDSGLELQWGSHLFLGATYYHQVAVDLIDQVLVSPAADSLPQRYQNRNVGRIHNTGVEVEGRLSWPRLQLTSAVSIGQSTIRQLSPTYAGDYRIGDRVIGLPRTTAGVTLHYRPGRGTALYGSLTHADDWVERNLIAFYGFFLGGAPYRGSDRAYWMTYPGFTKVNLGVEQQLHHRLSAALLVENLAHSGAFEVNNLTVPSPRTVTLTVRATY